MLPISKGPEPAAIQVLRQTPGATWKSVHDDQKAEMRAALLREQAGLCAYCMRRVRGERDASGQVDMTVEHWAARSGGADPFHWPDLLGVCRGKTGNDEHCDRARGDRALTLHPARPPAVDALVRHLGDRTVEIDARDSSGRLRRKGHDADLRTLNLNAPGLRKDRREVVDAVLGRAAGADATRLRALLSSWETPDAQGLRPEFAGVAAYLLRRALSRREARSRRVRRLPRT